MDNTAVVSYYEGNAKYEPAEGGYYVEESLLQESTGVIEESNALDQFNYMLAQLIDYYGVKPTYVTKTHAHFEYGNKVGETADLWIENYTGEHTKQYEGYR